MYIFMLLITFCTVSTIINSEKYNDTRLIAVAVIFRHGARTPSSFYKNDPHKNNAFNVGLGALTNEGKMQQYRLGQYLREMYDSFLGEDWIEDHVYVRSTSHTRSRMSAELVLAGLFPPSDKLRWNLQLAWNPTPIYYSTRDSEDLFHPFTSCPLRKHVLKNLRKNKKARRKYIVPYRKLYKYVQEQSGKKIQAPFDIYRIHFVLKCEETLNLPLPNWTKSVYPNAIEAAANTFFPFTNFDPRMKKINCGYLLKKILDDFKAKMNGNIVTKLFLYSGHKATLGFLLDGLNLTIMDHIPDFNSAIQFELRRKNRKYFIIVRYKKSSDSLYADLLKLPGCTTTCPYKKFVSLVQQVLPTQSIEEACKLPFSIWRIFSAKVLTITFLILSSFIYVLTF